NFQDNFRLLTSSGLCIAGSILNNAVPPQQLGCNANVGEDFQILSLSNNTYNLRNTPMNQCLSTNGATIQLGSCTTPAAALKIIYTNESPGFRVFFIASGMYAASGGNAATTQGLPLVQQPFSQTPAQLFAIRSLHDMARRMNVITYNMML